METLLETMQKYKEIINEPSKKKLVKEGFMGLSSWAESDEAADVAYEVAITTAKILTKALKQKANEYNTPGYVNVALVLVSLSKSSVFHTDEMRALAVTTLEMLKTNQRRWAASDVKQQYQSLILKLEKAVQVL